MVPFVAVSEGPEEVLPSDFGKYRLVRKIATGGMAEIFLAHAHDRPDAPLVIKRILPNLLKSAEFVSMFLDEARIAAQLKHENIVRIEDIGQFQGSYYITMEYVHGEDIRRIYNSAYKLQRSLPLSLSIRVVAEAAKGLSYAHKLTDFAGRPVGLVHRDVSPQNILVTYEGGVKIVDFGIAKAATKVSQTRAGVLKGKYSYMSPEQAVGEAIDHRTDIFALGIILYETTTGTRLFKRHNELATLQAIIKGEVTPPSEALRGYPPELERILLKALARDAKDRYLDAQDFADALIAFLKASGLYTGPEATSTFMRDLFAERLAEEEALGGPALPGEDEVREELRETRAPSEPSNEGALIPAYRTPLPAEPGLDADLAPLPRARSTSFDPDAVQPGFQHGSVADRFAVTTPELSEPKDSRAKPQAVVGVASSDPLARTLEGEIDCSGVPMTAAQEAAVDPSAVITASGSSSDLASAFRSASESSGSGGSNPSNATRAEAPVDLLPTMAAELVYRDEERWPSSRRPTDVSSPVETVPHTPVLVPARSGPSEDRRATDGIRQRARPGSPLQPPERGRLLPRIAVLVAAIVAALLAGIVASQIATSLTDGSPGTGRFGRVTIVTEPGATVWSDGEVLGAATTEGIAGPFRIASGAHRLKVVSEGLVFERERAIEVQADHIHEFEIRARKGWLAMKIHPWARVILDGVDLGLTPLPNRELFEGPHRVILENPDIGARSVSEVRIAPGETFELKINLNDVARGP